MGGVLGTGVAAGVAQTAHQAQQLARQRDKRVRDAKRLADHQLEVQRAQVEGLEEIDAAEDVTRIHIDNQVPEHEHRNLPEARRRSRGHGELARLVFPLDRAELRSRLPLPVDASKLTGAKPAPEPPAAVAAAYQHTRAEPDAASVKSKLDLKG